MSKNKKRVFKKGHILLQEGEKKIYCYLVPRRSLLVLLVKVGARQGRVFGSEESKCVGKKNVEECNRRKELNIWVQFCTLLNLCLECRITTTF
jgi:hypothetical protein